MADGCGLEGRRLTNATAMGSSHAAVHSSSSPQELIEGVNFFLDALPEKKTTMHSLGMDSPGWVMSWLMS